jgi:hypothetical protein
MSYSHKDWNLAYYALKVLIKHTDFPVRKFVLYASEGAPVTPKEFNDMGVELMRCGTDSAQYPLGPNSMFANLMKHAADRWQEPIFMCEPDGFPTCRNWYERIRDAHNATKRLASGSWIDWVNPPHFNGNMVVDPMAPQIHPCLTRITFEAWDVFHAEFFAKYGAVNPEIYNPHRPTKFLHTGFWKKQALPNGYKPAWIHGCQSFQMWEHINQNGFEDDAKD